VHAVPDCSHGKYRLAMQLRIWAATVPWSLSVLGIRTKVQVPALKCLMHLQAERHYPSLFENLRVLRLVFVLVRWEFQDQVMLRDALSSSLSTESPKDVTRRGKKETA
jgi:hypothetical protein